MDRPKIDPAAITRLALLRANALLLHDQPVMAVDHILAALSEAGPPRAAVAPAEAAFMEVLRAYILGYSHITDHSVATPATRVTDSNGNVLQTLPAGPESHTFTVQVFPQPPQPS